MMLLLPRSRPNLFLAILWYLTRFLFLVLIVDMIHVSAAMA